MIFDAIRQGDADQVRALLAADPVACQFADAGGRHTGALGVYTRHAGTRADPARQAANPISLKPARSAPRPCRRTAGGRPAVAKQYSGDGFTGLGFACFLRTPGDRAPAAGRGRRRRTWRRATRCGVAPLHSAVTAGTAGMVELLLDHGADPNPEEASGHDAAAHRRRPRESRNHRAATGRRRRPNTATTSDGRTPADIARQYGHAEDRRRTGSLNSLPWYKGLMPTYHVETPQRCYSAIVERGVIGQAAQYIPPKTGKVFVVTTEDVWRHAGAPLAAGLAGVAYRSAAPARRRRPASAWRTWKRWPRRWCSAAPTAPAW